ncbi:MAG: hypothetical protein QM820_65715 [Minicystis sp.]
MHNPFDQLAKKIGKGALAPSGATIVQYEISRDAQHADIRHDPSPAHGAERARLGLLGRIAEVLCLIEIFGHAPDGEEFRACISKHLAHWAESLRRGRAHNRRRRQKVLSPEPVVEPRLWIIAAAFSAPMLRKLEVKTAPGWPAGVYFHGDDVYRVGIIVANELPRERFTLLVRLMAAGPHLPDAIADLAALPADAHERIVAEDVVIHLQHQLAKKPNRSPEEEEFIVKIHGNWETARKMGLDEGRREGRDEGRREGRDEGRAEEAARAVLTVLRVRGIAVPDGARERILAEKDPARLERWHERAILAASIAEVLDEPS